MMHVTQIKIAELAKVSCSDLLENENVYIDKITLQAPTCPVSFFFWAKFPTTNSAIFFWKHIPIYKSSFKTFVSFGWIWFLFCMCAKTLIYI